MAEAAPLALEIDAVSVRFGGVHALERTSLEVRSGEVVGLIGSNGAGKTTLMDCVSGFVRPQEGRILVMGQDVVGLAPEVRPYLGVGRSFQDARLFPGLTVGEAVLVAFERHRPVRVLAALAGLGRGAEREKREWADELIAQMGLEPYRDKLVSELSTGTRRIVDIASILAQRPAVLLLDEPTAGIAQKEAEVFVPLLDQVRAQLGCSILIVEHDMPLIMAVSDRIYAMETGTVIAEGPPDVVRRDPRVISSYLGTDEAAILRSGAQPGVGRHRTG
ncbi:MAG TPA: ABC transporter ATP-binding protein [Acidimicrobiales bacterium]|nr:ABC transporter ATP-binding protein [Acidimicrobiales bacterium]